MVRSEMKSIVIGMSLLGAAVVGCGGEPKKDPMMQPAQAPAKNDRPAWVNKGSGAYPGEKGKIFSVGISPAGMDDESLARETADNDGRIQMQRVFEVYIAALMESYKRATMKGGKGQTEIDIKSVSRSLTEGTLRGSQIVDHWQNPQNGTWYSLVVIDLAAFKEFTQAAKDLDASVKEYIRDNAEKAQDDLDKRLAEKGSGGGSQ